MSNSSLVTYTNLTSNCNKPRKSKIDTITIHCYVGQVTAKQGCDYFVSVVGKREVSSNYVVGYDGSIGLSVEECNRAWTSSNASNDHRAVTIEVACEPNEPWVITDAAYKALVSLVADICKRNDIKQLLWKNDKSLIGQVDKQNITIHKWFAATACPGTYILSKMDNIVKDVNSKLGASSVPAPSVQPTPTTGTLYRVQVGAFSNTINANLFLVKVKAKGFTGFVTKVGNLYKVQVGAFTQKANATNMLNKLKEAGFNGFIVTEETESIKIGSVVRVNSGATTYTGGKLSSFVYKTNYLVSEINKDRVVIINSAGVIIAAVNIKDLTLVG